MTKTDDGIFSNKLLLVGIAIAVILLLWFVGTYNALISADQNVNKEWANVQAQYQRRIDLIPNLVNTVTGFMQFERGLLQNLTALRSQWASATTPEQQVQVANEVENALGRLIAVVEAYPEIKSNTAVIGLMDELAGTENRIAVARMNYNNAVIEYNKLVKYIPSNIVAGWMGFKEKTPFQAKPGSETAPVVNITP